MSFYLYFANVEKHQPVSLLAVLLSLFHYCRETANCWPFSCPVLISLPQFNCNPL